MRLLDRLAAHAAARPHAVAYRDAATGESLTWAALHAAVAALVDDPENLEKSAALDEALRAATLLLAGDTHEEELHPFAAESPDGLTLLAAFSDETALRAFVQQSCDVAEVPSADVFALGLHAYEGVVLDPAGPEITVPLPQDVLERLLGSGQDGQQV